MLIVSTLPYAVEAAGSVFEPGQPVEVDQEVAKALLKNKAFEEAPTTRKPAAKKES